MHNHAVRSTHSGHSRPPVMYRFASLTLLLMLLTTLFQPGAVRAETSSQTILEPSFTLGGGVGEVTGAGDILYYLKGARLIVADVSNPKNPVTLAEWSDVPRLELGPIYQVGSYLYIMEDHGLLTILDVQNPAHPTAVRSQWLAGSYPVSSMVGGGGYLYIVQGDQLTVLDVRTPDQPRVVKTLQPIGSETLIRAIAMGGGYLYLMGPDRLSIYSLAAPENPVSAGGSLAVTGYKGHLAKLGNTLFAFQDDTIASIDVSNPAAPRLIGAYTGAGTHRYEYGVAGPVNLLLVVDANTKLMILDTTNPASLKLKSSLPILSSVWSIYQKGTIAYLAAYESGLSITDLSNPAAPKLVKTIGDQTIAKSVVSEGGITLASFGKQLYRMDGAASRVVYTSTREIADVKMSGTLVSVAEEDPTTHKSWLVILDFANTNSPTKRSTTELNPLYPTSLHQMGKYLIVAGIYEIVSLDVQNPDSPTVAGAQLVSYSSNIRSLASSGSSLLVLKSDGLKVFTLNADGTFHPLGENSSIRGNGIGVLGQYAYAQKLGSSNAAEVIDISDPANPVLTGTTFHVCGMVDAVQVSGNRLYVTDGCRQLQMFDLADPAAPQRIDSVYLPSMSGWAGIAVQGETIHVAAGAGGYVAFQVKSIADVIEEVPVTGGTVTLPSHNQAVSIPSGAFAEMVVFYIMDIPNPAPSPYRAARIYFLLAASNLEETEAAVPSKPLTITIPLSLTNSEANASEGQNQPCLLAYNGITWTQEGILNRYDPSSGNLTATLTHFSGSGSYGVFLEGPEGKLFLPIVRQ